jgi:hypothetical protein
LFYEGVTFEKRRYDPTLLLHHVACDISKGWFKEYKILHYEKTRCRRIKIAKIFEPYQEDIALKY